MYEDYLVFNEPCVLENQKKKFVISLRKVHEVRLSGGSNGQLKLARQDATRMHVTSGFYPGEGAKHDLGQG
jgi:hypothetical protein